MKGWRERDTIRTLHLVLSIPILGFIYGPVADIARAAWFTRWIAIPVVLLSGFWLWLKPKVMARINSKRMPRVRAAAVKDLRTVRYGTK